MAPHPISNSSSSKKVSSMKQGTLFSFFSKKSKASATATIKSAGASGTSTAPPPPAVSKPPANPLLEQLVLGQYVEVYWKNDNAYYLAKLIKHQPGSFSYYLEYEDGSNEWIDFSTESFRFQNKRKRTIQESDESEHEFELDGEESEFEAPSNDDDDDDEDDQWMVTDDEEDQEIVAGKPSKKKQSGTNKKQKVQQNVTPKSSKSLGQFAAGGLTVTEHQGKTPTPPASRPKSITPSSSGLSQKSTAPTTTVGTSGTAPPMFVEKALNPAGSHVHNHLKFLQQPRDNQGRTPDHPQYDCRTLRIVESDWKNLMGKGMTDAVKQWWDLKAQYFDTVLLFKTGKFYEMFHMDADVGVQHCGLSYMKGHVAHAGFPEISYGSMADKLVKAGKKVARVEQTETPEQLKERKKGARKGTAPKVVNREVCSILTMGTRTFCYLDDPSNTLEDTMGGASPVGPLLAIREVLLETSNQNPDSSVQPVCEYGVTLVDAVRGIVTIGQFADDVLRSRMSTLLTSFAPSEILLEGGENGASPTLQSLIRSFQSLQNSCIETIQPLESFPQSTAIDPLIRRQLERGSKVQPWNGKDTLDELHRRNYFPRASKQQDDRSISRWPKVLQAVIEGEAELALSSFGAVLFYLQRNLIDSEILSMGLVKAYIPPESSTASEGQESLMRNLVTQEQDPEFSDSNPSTMSSLPSSATSAMPVEQPSSLDAESQISHMSLDGTTLHNLEILANSVTHTTEGSLWSKINHTKCPHGSRLLRAWLLRPLFRKADIERRADAVEELVSGSAAVVLSQARSALSKCGDIERLLNRVHSMSGGVVPGDNEDGDRVHPQNRQVLYESAVYTKRKVGDFSKLLQGLRSALEIPEVFNGIEIQSGLLAKIVRFTHQGGCFPDMGEDLEWFFDNFDCEQAAQGQFQPSRGMDEPFDQAFEAIENIVAELNSYKEEMCANHLSPRSVAKSSWKYVNVLPESKDKYMIELPASVTVPCSFILLGKRGKGPKQVNKYRTPHVERLVADLERAYDVLAERRARGMELIFARFDAKRNVWAAAAQATALLDALGSLAQTASKAGFVRPVILDCAPDDHPRINILQGRHPCVFENTYNSSEFIPNDLSLGGSAPRILLLSGPNMGGKSTLLRQTCLIAILAQIGSFVPADVCELTPVDRIFTRLGASDRILLNQSTFFVELAETATALRGASRRSLVITDELGRGTSTFDGTAIASATVQHLIERNQCITLFATHYHSLLEEWKADPSVVLGHMECVVEEDTNGHGEDECNITFLYTLGPGVCPKSFGINVARLAGLPSDVLEKAKRISTEFEQEMNGKAEAPANSMIAAQKDAILDAVRSGSIDQALELWQGLQ